MEKNIYQVTANSERKKKPWWISEGSAKALTQEAAMEGKD